MPSSFPIANFLFNQGSSFRKLFIYLDSAQEPIDLTEYSARMQLREAYASPTPVVNLTTENGGIEIEPLDGEILVRMTPAQTEAIAARDYFYDLEIESLDGKVYRVIEGRATCRPEVTRDQGL